jgi:hypothetical protein
MYRKEARSLPTPHTSSSLFLHPHIVFFPRYFVRLQVLAFARTLGESSGEATQRKRVPFVAFAKGKPKVPATASGWRGRAGKEKLGSGRK